MGKWSSWSEVPDSIKLSMLSNVPLMHANDYMCGTDDEQEAAELYKAHSATLADESELQVVKYFLDSAAGRAARYPKYIPSSVGLLNDFQFEHAFQVASTGKIKIGDLQALAVAGLIYRPCEGGSRVKGSTEWIPDHPGHVHTDACALTDPRVFRGIESNCEALGDDFVRCLTYVGTLPRTKLWPAYQLWVKSDFSGTMSLNEFFLKTGYKIVAGKSKRLFNVKTIETHNVQI